MIQYFGVTDSENENKEVGFIVYIVIYNKYLELAKMSGREKLLYKKKKKEKKNKASLGSIF